MSDSELVERARAGDPEAFGLLVDRHRTAIYRAALAVLGVREDAEDAAQEALILAYRKLDAFRGESSFKTWLLTIVWRQALDRRKGMVYRLKRFTSSDDEGWVEPVRSHATQERAAAEAELRAQTTRLVRALPARLRDALLLLAAGDHTYEQAAEILGEPVGTVKWRVMEARKQLRLKLRRLGYLDEAAGEVRAAARERT